MSVGLVREVVYETLRKHNPSATISNEIMTTSNSSASLGSDNACGLKPGLGQTTPNSSSIKGIRSRLLPPLQLVVNGPGSHQEGQESPPELPPPPDCSDVNVLYAKVDPAKKRRNREQASNSR